MNAHDGDLTQQLAQLQRDVQHLKDLEAIKRLKHAYFRAIDSADLNLLAEVLHTNVSAHFIGGTYEWTIDGCEEYLEAIANSFNAEVVCQHHGHHPEIDIVGENEARGVWYLHDLFYDLRSRKLTHGTAFYKDHYVREAGKWWIKDTYYHRHYEIVESIDGCMPNITVQYLASHGRKLP